ncbi:MAG TPA: DUF1203 domain-containing protein [Myxococcales bacterium]|nr:DUF1203 domain-containing protein [Myxococcales bacterium]
MTPHRIVSVPTEVAASVRKSLRDPKYGHPAYADIARGYGPCRVCLRKTVVGEQRILFTYDPSDGLEPYPLPSPVYVHGAECAAYGGAGFPEELRDLPLTFEAYERGRRLIAVERTGAQEQVAPAIDALLARADVDYLHVRNTEAGCYILRIERS